MGKEIFAFILLALLITFSALNIIYFDNLIGDISEKVDASQDFALEGDYDNAVKELMDGFETWNSSNHYSRAMLRSTALDSVSDAFCQILNDLDAQDGTHAGSYEKLRLSLHSVSEMEQLSLGTIF